MNSIRKFVFLLAVLALAVGSATTYAHDTVMDDREKVLAALDGLLNKGSVVFDGTTSAVQPNALAGVVIAPRMVVQVAGNGLGNQQMETVLGYEGPFKLWLNKQGEFVLASSEAFPGILVYNNGEESAVRAQYLEEKIGAGRLASELPKLANLRELRRLAARAESVKPVAGAAGTYRFDIPTRHLASDNGAAQPLGPFGGLVPFGGAESDIQRIFADVTCSRAGEVTAIKFSVVRQNSELLVARRMGAGRFFFQQEEEEDEDAAPQEGKKDKKKQDQEEGDVFAYELKVTSASPSAEMKVFADAVRKHLETK